MLCGVCILEPAIQTILLQQRSETAAVLIVSTLFRLIVQYTAHASPYTTYDTQSWSQLFEHNNQPLATVLRCTHLQPIATTYTRSPLLFQHYGEIVNDTIKADTFVQYDGVNGCLIVEAVCGATRCVQCGQLHTQRTDAQHRLCHTAHSNIGGARSVRVQFEHEVR